MEHLYHGGWDCVCEAQLTLDGFQAVVTCRSLIDGHIEQSIVDRLVHDTASKAIRRAMEVAVKWVSENRHTLQRLR